MRSELTVDWHDCSEFRQLVRAQVPRLMHATSLVLVLLLVVAFAWAALTHADVVIRATGRLRPLTPTAATGDFVSEELASEIDGRIVELRVEEGQRVRQGDIIAKLDTQRIVNRREKLRRTIHSGEAEMATLAEYERLLKRQFASAKQKAEAELTQADAQLKLSEQQRVSKIRLAKLELKEAEDKVRRARKLVADLAIAEETYVGLVTAYHEAREKLREAKLPVDRGQLEVLRRGMEVVRREYEVKGKDLEIKKQAKLGEIEAAQWDLASLELDLEQAIIRAPTAGVVTVLKARVGDIANKGKLGVTIAQQQGLEFEVAVANEDVAQLQPGMSTRIKLDAYDYQEYGTLEGVVHFVSPDSELVGDEQSRKTAMYKVRISLASDKLAKLGRRGQVKLGMTGRAEIVIERDSILKLLLKKVRQSISLG